MRRDLINAEISNLRDLLPLPPSTRQRLSQLQLMALVCVYVRKMNYFQQVFKSHDFSYQYQEHATPTPNIGFSKAMNGFMMMLTQNGKLLYISENATEYLGHSMEDLLIHGDSVYDIIDRQDHQAVQMELNRGIDSETDQAPKTRHFFCRMNVSRNARRQMRFGDQKVVLVRGHYVSYVPLCSRNEPVLVAQCTPLAMPETREAVVLGATNLFTTVHAPDMKFLHADANAEWYLGWKKSELTDVSWYQLLHWDSLREAQAKHRLITQSDQEKCCILLVRLQQRTGQFLWVHTVLQVKEATDTTRQYIVATNQVLSEEEASIMVANSWLYQYYGYQNQPCSIFDPRCQKFFKRDNFYQEPYPEHQSYLENQELEYSGYQVSQYSPNKAVEDYACEPAYLDKGPVDYSTHSPQSSFSEERSPIQYESVPESSCPLYAYPHPASREYYDAYTRLNYTHTDAYEHTNGSSTEYPSAKRMRLTENHHHEDAESIDRWNPSPPWSDTIKHYEFAHKPIYNHILPHLDDRAMVT